jgi:hypothetical protein
MAAIQSGNSAAGLANVTPEFELQTALTKVRGDSGYSTTVGELDTGNTTSLRRVRAFAVTDTGKSVSTESRVLFDYHFNTLTQDTGQWRYLSSIIEAAWTTAGLLLNSTATGNFGLIGASAAVGTWQAFGSAGNALKMDFTVGLTTAISLNQEFTLAWAPFSLALPTEGVYFVLSSSGLFGFSNFNGVESSTGQLASAESFGVNVTTVLSIVTYQNITFFLRDGKLLPNGTLAVPAANGQQTSQGCFPVYAQFRNTGTVTGSPVGQARVTDVSVQQFDTFSGLDGKDLRGIRGLMGSQATAASPAQGSTAAYVNNQASIGSALSNTTAARFLGLGGQFGVRPSLAVYTDGILCSFQVPTGSVNATQRALVVFGVRIQSVVVAPLENEDPLTYAYSLAYGHTALSLGTAEGANSKAPRRIPIGLETLGVTAPEGTQGQGIDIDFRAPIVVNPGEFIAIAAKNLTSVSTTGAIIFLVTFDSMWL